MPSSRLISRDIELFYNAASEEHRLQQGLGPLELERTQELITRYLPAQSAAILDIGGGTGHYAAWLAALGHSVHLVDPVEKHIQLAGARAKRSKRTFHCRLGEARQLPFPPDTADMLILHGPLYHLQSGRDRAKALEEARRVLKPGGVLLGVAINHSASLLTGLLNGLIHQPEFLSLCKAELLSGDHDPIPGWPGMLPEAYFHKPAELRQEVEAAGFTHPELLAVEGCVWLDRRYFESRADTGRKATLNELLRITEKEPSLMGLSPHLMIAARK